MIFHPISLFFQMTTFLHLKLKFKKWQRTFGIPKGLKTHVYTFACSSTMF